MDENSVLNSALNLFNYRQHVLVNVSSRPFIFDASLRLCKRHIWIYMQNYLSRRTI